MRKTYSFDIFDTCFVRACGKAINIFDLLAYRILGTDSVESVRCDFAAIRVEAEKTAREKSDQEDITLDEIYKCCCFDGLTSVSNDEIKRTELNVENEQLIPVYSICQQIKALHESGKSVVYISDMYLPQDFLVNLLKKHGFWKDGDKLYVSSQYRATKEKGSLYQYIAKENNLKYRDWCHFGDNVYSDFKVPKKLGINAHLVKHEFSYYEKYILKKDVFPGFFINEHMAGISKAARLSSRGDVHSVFAADLIAPLYVPLVFKILCDAQKNNIRTLGFLARDGFVLYNIAKEFQRIFPQISIKYIYASRKSLYFPGIGEITSEKLKSLFIYDLKCRKIRDSLNGILDDSIVDKLFDICPDLNTTNSIEEACDMICRNEDAVALLDDYRMSQRNYIIKYFLQEGLIGNNTTAAVIDVRGSRNCQKAINDILSQNGYDRISAYYLEVLKNRISISRGGQYKAYIYRERCDHSNFSHINGNVLEEYFSLSPHARTIGYIEDGEVMKPKFDDFQADKSVLEICDCHNEVISKYCGLFISNFLFKHLDAVKTLSLATLLEYSNYPKYEYLLPLKDIKQRGTPLLVNLLNIKNRNRPVYWMNGSIYYTFNKLPDKSIRCLISVMSKLKFLLGYAKSYKK